MYNTPIYNREQIVFTPSYGFLMTKEDIKLESLYSFKKLKFIDLKS